MLFTVFSSALPKLGSSPITEGRQKGKRSAICCLPEGRADTAKELLLCSEGVSSTFCKAILSDINEYMKFTC